jgi:hypothetical protein
MPFQVEQEWVGERGRRNVTKTLARGVRALCARTDTVVRHTPPTTV